MGCCWFYSLFTLRKPRSGERSFLRVNRLQSWKHAKGAWLELEEARLTHADTGSSSSSSGGSSSSNGRLDSLPINNLNFAKCYRLTNKMRPASQTFSIPLQNQNHCVQHLMHCQTSRIPCYQHYYQLSQLICLLFFLHLTHTISSAVQLENK